MYTNPDGEYSQKSNMFSLSGNGFFGAVSRSVDLGKTHHIVYLNASFLMFVFVSKSYLYATIQQEAKRL